jgi:ACS family tartrate transporter-like MFS transporter
MLASAWTPGLVTSLIALSIAMAGLAAMLGPFWTLATSFVQGAAAAAGIALINSVANIGGFIGPYVLGALKDRTGGFAAGSLVIGAIVIACGLVVLALPDGAPAEPSVGLE